MAGGARSVGASDDPSDEPYPPDPPDLGLCHHCSETLEVAVQIIRPKGSGPFFEDPEFYGIPACRGCAEMACRTKYWISLSWKEEEEWIRRHQ